MLKSAPSRPLLFPGYGEGEEAENGLLPGGLETALKLSTDIRMSRSTSKVRLENGLKLDLNLLVRRKFIILGATTGPCGIEWSKSYWGVVASGTIRAWMDHSTSGYIELNLGGTPQRISLIARSCHFGGLQWYFICPVTGRRASVLWKPPGATRFCSRHAWGRQVAYTSQCLGTVDRAWRTKSKIKNRLIGDLDPDDWDLPPKPKWMRWKTYRRYEERFDRQEDLLDREICLATARLLRTNFLF